MKLHQGDLTTAQQDMRSAIVIAAKTEDRGAQLRVALVAAADPESRPVPVAPDRPVRGVHPADAGGAGHWSDNDRPGLDLSGVGLHHSWPVC